MPLKLGGDIAPRLYPGSCYLRQRIGSCPIRLQRQRRTRAELGDITLQLRVEASIQVKPSSRQDLTAIKWRRDRIGRILQSLPTLQTRQRGPAIQIGRGIEFVVEQALRQR